MTYENQRERKIESELKSILWWAWLVSVVLTIVSGIADVGLMFFGDVPHWVHTVFFICTFCLVVSQIWYNTEAARQLLGVTTHNAQALFEIQERVEQTFRIVGQKAVVTPIEPRDPLTFRMVFGDADKICAYNPPLTLLTSSSDAGFREVIFNFLQKNASSYRAIVGQQGVERLTHLHDLWISQYGAANANRALPRMLVTSYLHPEGLHTMQHPWPAFGEDDVRGLSFFLIETPQHRKVLLYILGKPFVYNFEVPDLGLLITEPADDAKIYGLLHAAFDSRWGILLAAGADPNILADLTLPAFCAQYKLRPPPAAAA
jgi:hypothetical protein